MASAKKLPSGRYRVNLFVGMENGKRKYKSFTADNRKDAEYMAARYAATMEEESRSEVTLSAAMKEYILCKENILSPSTIRGYYTILNIYTVDMASIKIKDLNQRLVQTYINKYAAMYSPKTCRNIHGLISAVLKIHKPELVLRTTLPQKRKKDIYVPDTQEVEHISKLAVGKPVYIPFLLATQCGLRASEISGLELKNVHPDYIEVTQARVRGKDGEAVKQPKSVSGYRKVPINEELYNILLENAAGDRVCGFSSDTIGSVWRNFRTKYKINKSLNFHALRHHYASKCLLLGIPQKYIAELMGHRDTNMIEKVYQHTFPSAMQGYAEQIRQNGTEFFNATRNATQ